MSITLFSPTLGDQVLVPVWPNAGPPTSGTSGTLAGYVQTGDLLVDETNGNLYMNTGTQASPTWIQYALQGVGYARSSYAAGLVAVGTSRANALALTAQTNHVVTAASAAVGVVLPASSLVGVGGVVTVINDGPSNAFHVYAAGSDTIDGTTGSTGVSLTNAFLCNYQVDAAGAFISYRQPVTRSA